MSEPINVQEALNSDEERRAPTLVSFILDESTSMESCRQQTINGFNEYKQTLTQDTEEYGEVLLSITKFGTRPPSHQEPDIRRLATVQAADEVDDLSFETFRPNGNTPLFDCIANVINETQRAYDEMEDKPRVIFVVLTDGQENMSREYNAEQIREMISGKEGDGWVFAFLGADQDAWANSRGLGFSRGSTMSYDSCNTDRAYASLSRATTNVQICSRNWR